MPYPTRPVFVAPEHPLTVQEVMAVNREHYEGTELDQTAGYTLMSPHDQTNRPICYSYTDYGAVWQLRSWLPPAVGGILYLAPSRPCSSAFVPFYAGITSIPTAWTGKTAFNAFRAVATSLDKKGTVEGEIRYKHHIPLVRSTYGGFEAEVAAQQAVVDATAAALPPTEASAYLTGISTQRADQAKALADSLPAQMP